MAVAIVLEAVDYLDGDGGIEEVGGTDLHGGSAGHDEFEGICRGAYATEANHRYGDGFGHLPYHADSHRLDGRA